MTHDVDLLDPRHDAEPPYWEAWRRRAGQRANWAWPLVRAGAWTSRQPVLMAVLRADGEIDGVVAATVVGPRLRRNRFCPRSGWPPLAVLDVRAPQSSAQPGWWFGPDEPARRAALFRDYTRAVRRELGPRVRGVLWRQVPAEDLPHLPRRLAVRPTGPVAVLDTTHGSVEGWLAALRKERRRDQGRIFRAVAADPDLDVRMGPATAGLAEATELAHLFRLNHDKYGGAPADRHSGFLSTAWLAELVRRPDVSVLAYRDRSGRLVGASTVFDHPTCPLWHGWGAEPVDSGGRRNLYFDSFGRLVAYLVDGGRPAAVLGKGNADLKADLGARLVPQFAVVGRVG